MADFWSGYGLADRDLTVVEIAGVVVPLLLAVAYLTYAERKVLGACSCARGRTWSDRSACCSPSPTALKMFVKETIVPTRRQPRRVPHGADADLHPGAGRLGGDPVRRRAGASPTSMSASCICSRSARSASTASSWRAGRSNSRYAFLGALRSAAQMVCYEVSIGFVMVTVLLCAGSLNLTRHRAGAAARSGS